MQNSCKMYSIQVIYILYSIPNLASYICYILYSVQYSLHHILLPAYDYASSVRFHSKWASCQIRKLTGVPGIPGTFSPPPREARTEMHAGSLTSGFLWSRWRKKRSRHSRHIRNLLFYVSGKRPIVEYLTTRAYYFERDIFVSRIRTHDSQCWYGIMEQRTPLLATYSQIGLLTLWIYPITLYDITRAWRVCI